MENASKALIIAAEVLIGVMVISIGVALFATFSDFSRSTAEQIEANKLSEFNNSFLKYYGRTVITDDNGIEKEGPIRVSVHEIISLANLAKQNNIKYELENERTYNKSNFYVQIDADKDRNLEKWTEEQKNNFIKNNSLIEDTTLKTTTPKYYYLSSYEVSDISGRVMYVKFDVIK